MLQYLKLLVLVLVAFNYCEGRSVYSEESDSYSPYRSSFPERNGNEGVKLFNPSGAYGESGVGDRNTESKTRFIRWAFPGLGPSDYSDCPEGHVRHPAGTHCIKISPDDDDQY